MKIFKPTFLYIKQHQKSGKLYFGKTTRKDVEKYNGSGTYWKNHINKHGKEFITTLWFCLFTDQETLTNFALMFSNNNRIVESDEWANQINENGVDGGSSPGIGNGAFGKKMPKREPVSQVTRDKIATSKRKHIELFGAYIPSDKDKEQISETLKEGYASGRIVSAMKGVTGDLHPAYGLKHSEESKKSRSKNLIGEKNGMFGKQHSDSTKEIWKKNGRGVGEKNGMFGRTGKDNPNYGKKRDPELVERLAAQKRGKPQIQVKCPHCEKIGGITIMSRWHFDNCKFRQVEVLAMTENQTL